MKATVTRKAHFNAAHRLFNPNWSDEKNREVFGKCSLPNYHGHNYVVEASVTGPVDQDTGFVIDLAELKQVIKEEVEEPFDHKNLNLDTQEFKDLIPTAENIAVVIWNKLNERLKDRFTLHIKLYETERNIVEYGGE